MKNILVITGLLALSSIAAAQPKGPENWHNLDPKADKVYGTGVEQAYKTLNGRTAQTVVVAVIDGGTDTEHEDLKDVIWTNTGEIADNGIDDDKNGYVDDIHGWNFLGGKNGDINYEATELARMYQRLSKKYKDADAAKLNEADIKEYKDFEDRIRPAYLKAQAEQDAQAMQLSVLSDFMGKVKKQGGGVFSKSTVKSFIPDNPQDEMIKKRMKLILALVDAKDLDEQVSHGADMIINVSKYNRMNVDSIRQFTVGDNPNDPNERYYGNNNLKGPDARHGSHVAGIIGAIRNNSKGINGVAGNVKIMVVRAVPNGDERDKDVANAIRYAVDNGAKVINMSFGKYYSPDKKVVDEAVQYALSKDVLLLHAAGNDGKNRDMEDSYPSREISATTIVPNWIEVGASGYKKGKSIIGNFSNYGKKRVDLFAPGVDIYSTMPDNKYLAQSGTSMASPAAAGAAAVIRGYFPELKANEVRDVLMKTVVPYKKKVKVPGTKKEKRKVNELCISGGFINVNNAATELLKK
ncbi:MAG TPA: S8 family serine peptidase [Bacteroidia bacterium]|jgi:subtilisin family serine protease